MIFYTAYCPLEGKENLSYFIFLSLIFVHCFLIFLDFFSLYDQSSCFLAGVSICIHSALLNHCRTVVRQMTVKEYSNDKISKLPLLYWSSLFFLKNNFFQISLYLNWKKSQGQIVIFKHSSDANIIQTIICFELIILNAFRI